MIVLQARSAADAPKNASGGCAEAVEKSGDCRWTRVPASKAHWVPITKPATRAPMTGDVTSKNRSRFLTDSSAFDGTAVRNPLRMISMSGLRATSQCEHAQWDIRKVARTSSASTRQAAIW